MLIIPRFFPSFLNGPFLLGYGPAMVAMEGRRCVFVCVFQYYASLHFTSSIIIWSMEPLGPWSQNVKTSKLLRHNDSLKVEAPIVANFELYTLCATQTNHEYLIFVSGTEFPNCSRKTKKTNI